MIADGEEADETGDDETGDGAPLDGQTQLGQSPIDHTTQHTDHRIDLAVEDDGLVVEQHIADDTARRTRDAAHDDRHPEGLSEEEALLYAGDGEERQSEGVEDKPRILQRFHPLTEEDDGEQGDSRTYHIYRCGHPEGCGAEHDVADGSAADGHRDAADVTAKPVEVLGSRMADAGDRKGKRAQQLNHINYYILFQNY